MAGRDGQFRYAFERSAGLPGDDWVFPPFASETIDVKPESVADPNLDPSGLETKGQTLKAAGGGNVVGAMNTESWLQMRAHMHGYNEVSNPATGAYLWELRDLETGDTPIAYYKSSLSIGIWRETENNPTEYFVTDARAPQMQLSVNANEVAMIQHDILCRRDRFMRKPYEQAVNASWTGDIEVIGHRAAGDEGGDYYKFKVVDPGAVGVATIVWGKGADAYSATAYTTAARMDVRNDDDTLASGSALVPFQILLHPGGVFTADDEWRIYPWATKAVPSFSTRPNLNGAACEVQLSLGGQIITRVIDNYTLTHGVPLELHFGVGSIYAQRYRVPAEGKRWWELTFATTYVDNQFRQALTHSSNIEGYIKLEGAQIGSSGLNEYSEFTLDYLTPKQAGAQTANAGEQAENITLRAEIVRGSGAQACVERHLNTISSITPS